MLLLACGVSSTLADNHLRGPVLADANNVAVSGYDVVAYFNDKDAIEGRPQFTVEHNGYKYLFSSQTNAAEFSNNPEFFLPAYGGFCAYGIAEGYLVEIDPEAWTIHNNKLYLNYNLITRTVWQTDIDGYNTVADRNWPKLNNR